MQEKTKVDEVQEVVSIVIDTQIVITTEVGEDLPQQILDKHKPQKLKMLMEQQQQLQLIFKQTLVHN